MYSATTVSMEPFSRTSGSDDTHGSPAEICRGRDCECTDPRRRLRAPSRGSPAEICRGREKRAARRRARVCVMDRHQARTHPRGNSRDGNAQAGTAASTAFSLGGWAARTRRGGQYARLGATLVNHGRRLIECHEGAQEGAEVVWGLRREEGDADDGVCVLLAPMYNILAYFCY